MAEVVAETVVVARTVVEAEIRSLATTVESRAMSRRTAGRRIPRMPLSGTRRSRRKPVVQALR